MSSRTIRIASSGNGSAHSCWRALSTVPLKSTNRLSSERRPRFTPIE
jgi:hypothetical protein